VDQRLRSLTRAFGPIGPDFSHLLTNCQRTSSG
jgi:hypothetical protein